MQFTAVDAHGASLEFECADTIVSRWVCTEILRGSTYPVLPFVEGIRTIFDVGANCGATTVHFTRTYPEAQVHSFEPASEPRAILERNADAYPNVHVHPVGLHDVDDVVPLYKGDGDTILGSVLPRESNLGESEPVRLRVGATWAAEHGIDRIDLLKVDVEGLEVEVLAGLSDLLPTVKVIYIEYDSPEARRSIDRALEATHELYRGTMLLEQGECVYLRRDLAGPEVAKAQLRDLFEAPPPVSAP